MSSWTSLRRKAEVEVDVLGPSFQREERAPYPGRHQPSLMTAKTSRLSCCTIAHPTVDITARGPDWRRSTHVQIGIYKILEYLMRTARQHHVRGCQQ